LKILVDSNILISALFYPNSNPAKALYHAADNHELVLSDYNIIELRQIANKKFSHMQADVDLFLTELTYELIPAIVSPQKIIRDPKDAPILNAAIVANVDIIITGDRDFLELNLEYPKAIKASDYMERYL
jgi:putative PIN family toxin of toxin-antitoxin system